jgi:predicted RNase H-like HicB family nuclease
MTHYSVNIERSGRWWAISVPDLPGVFSQARNRAQVEAMAREAIALYLDVSEDSFGLSIREVEHLSEPVSH